MPSSRSYGSANGARHDVDEERPLLGNSQAQRGLSNWRTNLMSDVAHHRTDIVLLSCYLVTGLLDSASIQVWETFVSMQTGNTIYVALGLASLITTGVPTPRLLRPGISIISFCIGSFFFSRFHAYFSPKRRWVLCASYAAQTLFTVAAALIVTIYPPNTEAESTQWNVLVPVILLAFQSCGQAVTSRALKRNALISVVLTSAYCDLFSDLNLFAADNVERNRRAAAPFLLIVGAVVGGLFAYGSAGIAGALWIAAGLKLLMAFTWLFWPAEGDSEQSMPN